jgi:hypothetical protein
MALKDEDGGNMLRFMRAALLFMLCGLTVFGMASAAAASADLVWQKCLGGSSWEYARSVQPTADGGYIVAGFTNSTDGDVSGNHGQVDYWVAKLDCSGSLIWRRCLGGSGYEEAWGVQQTVDRGYILAGYTYSNDGDVSGNHGQDDFWVVKLDGSGNMVWQRCLGGSSWDEAHSILQTADGGYIVAGLTLSNDGNVSGNHGGADYWVVKLDGSGNMVWQRCLGGSSWDNAYSVQQTADGGYILAGYTNSNDGNVSGNHGQDDFWVVKLDGSGNMVWQRCLGGSAWDDALCVQPTADGGYVVSGLTASNDGNVSGNHGQEDFWVVKLDGSGNLLWQRCLGGSSWEYAWSAQPTADGGYVVAGYTYSNDGDVSGNHGELDFWVVLLDGTGNMVWQRCLGGSSWEGAFSVQLTSDGGYVLAGATDSNDGDVSGNHGDYDFWIVRLGGDSRFIYSYEDLLRSQAGLIGSFENLLKNTTLNSSMSYKFLDSFDDLAERQQRGLYSFEDLVSFKWSGLDACQKIKLTASYEDLLRRQAAIISSNEDLLKRDFCKLGTEDKKRLLERFEDRLKFEVVLLKKFEDWLHNQQMMEDTEYDAWIGFLSSFEDLIRRQSNLLNSFEMLLKIDCTEQYINLTKSAAPLQLNATEPVTYTYMVRANVQSLKDVEVKDSLWGVVGTIDNVSPGMPKTLAITRYPSCADCNNCTCKVCNFATACGEAITPNGNFTVCDVSNDVCAAVSEGLVGSPVYPGRYVAGAATERAATEEARVFEETGASGKWAKGDDVQVTLYFNRYPGRGSEPEGFDVYVDGKHIGRGTGDRFSFTVAEGHHDIRVNDGRQDYQQSLIFRRGEPKIIYVNAE